MNAKRGPGRPPADHPRRQRNVRVEDELWDAVEAAAREKGITVSDEVRLRLAQPVRAKRKRTPRET